MKKEKHLAEDIEAKLPRHPIMVMLVDDQAMIGEAVRRMLNTEDDIDYHYCINATEAEDTAKKIRPTVILQDLVMPDIEGLDLVKAYRSNPETKDIPIVVLSTEEDPKVKARAFELGANDYLVKLPDKVELIARVRYHSASLITKLQRDDAFRSLQESQRKLEALNVELLRLSTKDGLTGIPNRRCFDEQFELEWARARREKTPLSLLMIDIDFFKAYNDNLGHLAGDDALKDVASAIKAVLKRPADLAARYGGEEFVALLPNTDNKGAEFVAEMMRSAVEDAGIKHPGSKVSKVITVSIGVATVVPAKGEKQDNLIESADQALYNAKLAGRNMVVNCECDVCELRPQA